MSMIKKFLTSHVTHIVMHWRKMAEYTLVIQDAAQESGCDRVTVTY